ncbi:hypothetical protein BJ878DRAFT_537545 [Calycina marina]|uniref:Uncharacterized protein n=1 Tax=Calycina marina TaxID=1763456 RepID=A0A9P7ZC15_9HELO|nr:hypothetical protein BJ878DRAFT_537545 [Calycina marina]
MILSEYLEDALRSWLGSPMSCCGASRQPEQLQAEKLMVIEYGQPRLVPPPILEIQELEGRPSSWNHDWTTRSKTFASHASSCGSFPVSRNLDAYNSFQSGRPATRLSIGAPHDFRHIDNALPRREPNFRPLELSIYMPGESQISPILPHFQQDDLSFPPEDSAGSEYTGMHSRSVSSLSFCIPRKPVRSSSRASSEWTAQFKPRPGSLSAQDILAALESELPRVPLPARLRALTAPPTYERIRSALHEKYELEQRLKDIEDAIEEKQSVYFNSRPVSQATTVDRLVSITSAYEESQEPMPTILPTFTQRANLSLADQRPNTAPSNPVCLPIRIPTRSKYFTEASAAFTRSNIPPPPLPPLPLTLSQPPLHKKKSFSRVSNWLFPSDSHSRNISLDSITNTPKPIAAGQGFYQCITPQNVACTRSSERGSVSTVSTIESTIDAPTAPTMTTWSPHSTSSPGNFENIEKRDIVIVRTTSTDSETSAREKSSDEEMARTLGEDVGRSWKADGPGIGRNCVGVAF